MQHQSQAVALLRSGLFAPRTTDEIRANEIVNGVIQLGKARIPLDETHLNASQLENEPYYLHCIACVGWTICSALKGNPTSASG